MTSRKPYLIRGMYEWLLDNEVTPYILVDVGHNQISIPEGIATDGKVVLNLAPGAIQNLDMTNQHLSFSARFNGIAQDIYCPMDSVLAIYARENGEGMMFGTDDADRSEKREEASADDNKHTEKQKRPGLQIVK
ncbi:MAG: ClpXP protease specificity-enhancing factor [Gammaproteobacteria bacterium]|nr:ClpXP protease specificity-enhancing factor [Gammaproteobacteria bacterium]